MELKKEFYRYAEAGEILSVSVRQVKRFIQEGKLQRVQLGKSKASRRVTAESIKRFVAEIIKRNGSDHNPD